MVVGPPATISTNRRLTRRGVLWLGLRCDLRCRFCYDRHVPQADKIWLAYPEAVAALEAFRGVYDNRFVDFMGGEPTLHPQVVDLVAHAATIGLRPTLITHGMRLADPALVAALTQAGLHDVLMSVHGVGETAAAIHGRGRGNFGRQVCALSNLRAAGIPVRFNCTLIRDNLPQLGQIVDLAAGFGVRVVNFIVFNPAFEWADDTNIAFQARHSDLTGPLTAAIGRCAEAGIEANVRYLPLCQLPGLEAHVYTDHQLPYDPHEWDYNSWYNRGNRGQQSAEWYRQASLEQARRNQYVQPSACAGCAVAAICDGFHRQYVARWGDAEAVPRAGAPIADPCHFIRHQPKLEYADDGTTVTGGLATTMLTATQFDPGAGHRAGVRHRPATPQR
ncbi:MAG: radical SAM protein [Micromonosporaceae bacterium]|nr:radical SAM protein [Micromonosporaceae bacterium]